MYVPTYNEPLGKYVHSICIIVLYNNWTGSNSQIKCITTYVT